MCIIVKLGIQTDNTYAYEHVRDNKEKCEQKEWEQRHNERKVTYQ